MRGFLVISADGVQAQGCGASLGRKTNNKNSDIMFQILFSLIYFLFFIFLNLFLINLDMPAPGVVAELPVTSCDMGTCKIRESDLIGPRYPGGYLFWMCVLWL